MLDPNITQKEILDRMIERICNSYISNPVEVTIEERQLLASLILANQQIQTVEKLDRIHDMLLQIRVVIGVLGPD